MVRMLAVVILAFLSPGLAGIQTAEAHPLHTTFAELTHDTRGGALRISLRVFVDDFTKAAEIHSSRAAKRVTSAKQNPIADYAVASLSLTETSGKPIAMAFCGAKRVGDLMWLCFSAVDPSGGKGIRIASRVLFDQFDDQINVVKANYAGRTSSLLFTPGDQAKLLR